MTAPFSFAGRPTKMKRHSGKYLEDTIYGLRIIFWFLITCRTEITGQTFSQTQEDLG